MPESLNIEFKKRFSKNFSSNIIYFILNLLIGLAIVPFFLDTIGPISYALIPLATSLSSYLSIIIDSMNTSISRFLTIDLQRNDEQKANETFNTALFGTFGIIICLIPLSLIISAFFPGYFDIGEESYFDAFIFFSLIFGSLLIRALSSNFMVTLFATNHLNLRNNVNISNIIIQISTIVILFSVWDPSIINIGISYLIAAICSTLLAIYYSKKICPKIQISISFFVKKRLKEMGVMSLWVVIAGLGVLLRYQIALIIVNKLFGAAVEVRYSLANTWFILLIAIASLITSLLTPMIYSYYSQGKIENLVAFLTSTTRGIGLFMALPIALVCIFTPQLMTIWVGEEYANLSLLVWIIISPCLVKTQMAGVAQICNAYNKVRFVAIMDILLGFMCIILAINLPKYLNLGVYGVAIACSLSIIIAAGIITPLYASYILKKPFKTFFIPLIPGISMFFILCVIAHAFASILYLFFNPFLVMFIVVGTLTCSYYLLIINKAFTKNEKIYLKSCLPRTLQKYYLK